jgi:serine/threonine-protein kinase
VTLEPSRLADFRLAGALGQGATAKVFEAVHIATNRPVAIKMLEPSARGSELRERFAREALFLAGVQSRHVSRILGYGFDQGQPFLVLERLVGETLDAKLRRDGPVSENPAFDWVEQLIVGVKDIHAANVVHRDIKPGNIFIQREKSGEIVKVIDFGVARLLEVTDDGSQGLTSSSHLIGSVGYMSPEQFASASKVGPTADLYAVGVVIFRMITGQLPFVSRQIEAVIRMKREREPPVLSTMPGAPSHKQLDWFVSKAISKDPSARFQTAREMLDVWMRVRPTFGLDQDLTTNVDQGPRSYEVPSRRQPQPPSHQPRSYSPDSFARAPQTPFAPDSPAVTPKIRDARRGEEAPPQTMLSPGQNRDDSPESRTGVDIRVPPIEEMETYSDQDWDAVTEKRRIPAEYIRQQDQQRKGRR